MNNLEALRCLLCKKPRCKYACPIFTDVPMAMKLYRDGNVEEAAKILFENNPLTAITCQVCDWKKTCYGACVLNAKGNPVKWYEIEQEISIKYLEQAGVDVPAENGKRVCIVGAGPAGITAAIKLREKGFGVTVYDDHERLGGVLRYGIPSFRFNRGYVDAVEHIIEEAGIKFVGGTKIGKDLSVKDLRKKYDAVLIAGGTWEPRKLDIPGEEDERVIYAMEYLMDPDAYSLKGRIHVIGGGNVTMDASRTALRKGCDTTVYYRKTFENMPANVRDVEEAKADGVKFVLFEVPVAIKRDGDRRFSVIRHCENIIGEDGNVRTRMIPGTDKEVEFDYMIVAISENVDYGLFGEDMPETDRKGRPIVNEKFETSTDGVFLCGDFLTGPTTVANAAQSGKTAAQSIAEKLNKE